MNSFSSLDFLWRFLALITVVASISYFVGIAVSRVLRKRSPYGLKWFHRSMLVQLTIFMVMGFFFLMESNPLVDCFQAFASSAGAINLTRWLSLAWVGL